MDNYGIRMGLPTWYSILTYDITCSNSKLDIEISFLSVIPYYEYKKKNRPGDPHKRMIVGITFYGYQHHDDCLSDDEYNEAVNKWGKKGLRIIKCTI